MSNAQVPPRLHGILATEAPVVATFRKGPNKCWHVGAWHVGSEPRYEAGAWIRGTLYPRRSDISPDGRWLCLLIANYTARWKLGETYTVVSRLPWITALAAWREIGTHTRGPYFTTDNAWDIGVPDFVLDDQLNKDYLPCQGKYGMRWYETHAFANKLQRGWRESPDNLPREQRDKWDQHHTVTILKEQPEGGVMLSCRRDRKKDYGIPAIDGQIEHYELHFESGTSIALDVQWAEWSHDGRLLSMTPDGDLQIHAVDGHSMRLVWEHSLRDLKPAHQSSPDWAKEW